jgi:glycosyltransferase involved in cell wall biosynthesis
VNILYHHRTQGRGVEGVHIRGIVNALRELGHSVTVISPPHCDPFQEEPERAASPRARVWRSLWSSLSRHCPEVIFECLELLYNLTAYLKLRKVIAQQPVDLIYERYFLFSAASAALASTHRVPLIYEVNDSSFLPRLRRLRFTPIARAIERWSFSRAHRLATVTSHFKECLTAAGFDPKKIIVVPNGVDPALFQASQARTLEVAIPANRRVVGFVGLFVQWSDINALLHLFRRVLDEFPDIHLLLVGGGPEEPRIKQTILDLKLQTFVTVTGLVPHARIPSYINRMDICVILRHEKYTSPVKLFEYMAMGKAVLVPGYDSLQEVIRHRENGLLFVPENDDSFLDNLRELLTTAPLIRVLGEQARRTALETHTWRHNALAILNNTE